jgi:hypothetical protein
MIRNHEKFVRHYIKCGDKEKAYKKVYPGTSKQSARTGAARLLAREDVQAAVEKLKGPLREKEMVKLQEAVKEQMQLDILDTLQKRHHCAQIVLGKRKVLRHIRLKDRVEDVYDDPSPAAILRAIELDTKLEHGWHIRDKRAAAEKKKKDEEPKYPEGCEIEIHEFEKTDPEMELRRQWEAANPDKVNIEIIEKNESFTLSGRKYLVTPPWQSDPDWYEKQGGIPQNLPDQANQENRENHGSESVADCSNHPAQATENQNSAKPHPENSQAAINTLFNKSPNMSISNKSPLQGDSGYEDYKPLGKTIEEHYLIYLKDQHSINYRNHQNLLKLYEARKLPEEERAVIEKQTGWEFHPHNYGYIRKIPSMKKQVPSKGI